MNTKHTPYTPGPWKQHIVDETCILGADGLEVAQAGVPYDYDEHCERIAADARLIAAAPELLEALNTLVSRIEYYSGLKDDERPNIEQWEYTNGSGDMAAARAAIEKATGASHVHDA